MKELISKYSIKIQLFTAFSIMLSVVYITINITTAFERVARVAEGNSESIKIVNEKISIMLERIGGLEIESAIAKAKLEYLTK